MSVRNGQIAEAGALMSISATVPGPSARRTGLLGPDSKVRAQPSKKVTVRAGGRGAGEKSVPFVQATGNIAISVMFSGMSRSSLTLSWSASAAVTQAVPRPRARNATQKLQPDWMTESNRPGRPLPSWRPMMVGITMAGTSARCSARYFADAMFFSCGWPVPSRRSAAPAIHCPAPAMYRSASACFNRGSRITNQRRLDRFPPVGACSATSMQSRMIWSSTLRSRSSRRRTARVVVRA